jgi:hypothetical protein
MSLQHPIPEEDLEFYRHYEMAQEHLRRKEFHRAYEEALIARLRRPGDEDAAEIMARAVEGAYKASDNSLWDRDRPIKAAWFSSFFGQATEAGRAYERTLSPTEMPEFNAWHERWSVARAAFRARNRIN